MKTLILLEMAILAGGAIVARRATHGETWEQVLISRGPGKSGSATRVLIAVMILTVLLLSLTEIGAGTVAVLFGLVVALSYLLGAVGWLGGGMTKVEGELFG